MAESTILGNKSSVAQQADRHAAAGEYIDALVIDGRVRPVLVQGRAQRVSVLIAAKAPQHVLEGETL